MQATTEERIQALEAEVAWLKAQVSPPRSGVIGKTRPNFLESFTGIFADVEGMERAIQQERAEERSKAKDSRF